MIVDAASIIASLGGETIVLTRKTPSGYVAGEWVDAGEDELSILCSIQPSSAQERLLLPEGDRTRETVTLFCATELKTSDEGLGQEPDEFTWDGRRYRMSLIERWRDYWRGYAVAVDRAIPEAP